MNKSRRMAILKHRRRYKKLKEKRKALAMATGLGTVVAKPVTEVVKPAKPPAPKKGLVRKKKAEAAPVAAEPAAKAAKAKVAKKEAAKKVTKEKAPAPKKKAAVENKPARKKKTKTTKES